MKIWKGFGSEHSYNLVMIGRFRKARDAEKVKKLIDQLTERVAAEPDLDLHDVEPEDQRYSSETYKLLQQANLYSLGPIELRQLAYDASVRIEDNKIVVNTDEIDVSAFLKILLDKGARVEVYSAHEYPETNKDDES